MAAVTWAGRRGRGTGEPEREAELRAWGDPCEQPNTGRENETGALPDREARPGIRHQLREHGSGRSRARRPRGMGSAPSSGRHRPAPRRAPEPETMAQELPRLRCISSKGQGPAEGGQQEEVVMAAVAARNLAVPPPHPRLPANPQPPARPLPAVDTARGPLRGLMSLHKQCHCPLPWKRVIEGAASKFPERKRSGRFCLRSASSNRRLRHEAVTTRLGLLGGVLGPSARLLGEPDPRHHQSLLSSAHGR